MTTIAWKLFSAKKDGSVGPLFINRKMRLETGTWYPAEDHPTKGFAHRPGWHACSEPVAPHLSKRGRVWRRVELQDVQTLKRPASQGGSWYLAGQLRILPEGP